jgi:predicted oxidoreductase (fatty acid repression mutant protein)
MTATISYTLPEEILEFNDACNGSGYKSALWYLDQDLRAALKHNAFPEWDEKTTELIREKLWQILNEKNLVLD